MLSHILNSSAIGRHEADELELVREKFPYFQAAHILIAKCHKNQNTFGLNKNLKLASLYAGDRKVLFGFINQDEQIEEEKIEEVNPMDLELPDQKSDVSPEALINPEPSIESLDDEVISERILAVEKVDNSEERPIDIQNLETNEIEDVPDRKNKLEVSEVHKEDILVTESSIEEPIPLEVIQTEKLTEPSKVIQTIEVFEAEVKATDDEKIQAEDKFIANEVFQVEEVSNVEMITDETVEPDVEAIVSEDTTLVEEKQELPELNTEIGPEPNPLELDEADFMSWLDNFQLDKNKSESTELVQKTSKNAKEIEQEEILLTTAEPKNDAPVGELPLPIDEEEDTEYNPAAWAEIAYDIQAFVNVPEVKEEKNFQPKKANKEEIDELLERFIKKNPSISRPKVELFKPENMAKKSEEFHAEVVSESLANLFYKQKLLHKSLEMFEKLILQNPDKKDIFAARIKSIKEELINQL